MMDNTMKAPLMSAPMSAPQPMQMGGSTLDSVLLSREPMVVAMHHRHRAVDTCACMNGDRAFVYRDRAETQYNMEVHEHGLAGSCFYLCSPHDVHLNDSKSSAHLLKATKGCDPCLGFYCGSKYEITDHTNTEIATVETTPLYCYPCRAGLEDGDCMQHVCCPCSASVRVAEVRKHNDSQVYQIRSSPCCAGTAALNVVDKNTKEHVGSYENAGLCGFGNFCCPFNISTDADISHVGINRVNEAEWKRLVAVAHAISFRRAFVVV